MLKNWKISLVNTVSMVAIVMVFSGCEPDQPPNPPAAKETKLTLDFRLKWEGKEAFIQIGENLSKLVNINLDSCSIGNNGLISIR